MMRRLGLLVLAIGLLAAPVRGDDLSLGPALDTATLQADALVARALNLLQSDGAPTDADWRRAAVLLDAALQLSPADAELWRWRAELAQHGGDDAAQRLALRRYIELRPADDQAQWRLILLSLQQEQTLEQRVAAARRWVDQAQAQALSAALRSRVASAMAGWALEHGDRATAAARLPQALRLDVSNRQAALLALEVARPGLHPGAQARLTCALVRAAPHEHLARYALAQVLVQLGLPQQARQQMQAAVALGLTLGEQAQQAWQATLDNAPAPGPGSEPIAQTIARWPASLREPQLRQQAWALLDFDIQPTAFWRLQPMTATLTLRNGCAASLAVGDGEALPARVVIYLTPQVEGRREPTLPPVVVDLSRRLVLEPSGSVTVPVRLDRSAAGLWLRQRPWQTVTFTTLAVLDPVVLEGGAVGSSPLGAVAAGATLTCRALPPTAANIALWQAGADDDSADPAQRLLDLANLLRVAVEPGEGRDVARTWLRQRLATWPTTTLTWLAMQDLHGDADLASALSQRIIATQDRLLWLSAVSNPALLADPALRQAADQRHDADLAVFLASP